MWHFIKIANNAVQEYAFDNIFNQVWLCLLIAQFVKFHKSDAHQKQLCLFRPKCVRCDTPMDIWRSHYHIEAETRWPLLRRRCFKVHFLDENVWFSLKIPLKFVPRGLINNIPALVEIMAWRRPGDKPLPEPTLIFVPTHICVTPPQWDILCLKLQKMVLKITRIDGLICVLFLICYMINKRFPQLYFQT